MSRAISSLASQIFEDLLASGYDVGAVRDEAIECGLEGKALDAFLKEVEADLDVDLTDDLLRERKQAFHRLAAVKHTTFDNDPGVGPSGRVAELLTTDEWDAKHFRWAGWHLAFRKYADADNPHLEAWGFAPRSKGGYAAHPHPYGAGLIKHPGPDLAGVKDIDSKQGIVVGYLSTFNVIDSDNEYVVPGAFEEIIRDWGPEGRGRIAHLFDHDPTHRVGVFQKLVEDDTGLRFESKMSESSKGRDALIEYEEGVIKEHSFGYDVLGWERDADRDALALTKLRVYEGSGVTWGANMETPVLDVKSLMADPLMFEWLADQAEAMRRASEREVTDEKAIELEALVARVDRITDAFHKALSPSPRAEPGSLRDLLTQLVDQSQSTS